MKQGVSSIEANFMGVFAIPREDLRWVLYDTRGRNIRRTWAWRTQWMIGAMLDQSLTRQGKLAVWFSSCRQLAIEAP